MSKVSLDLQKSNPQTFSVNIKINRLLLHKLLSILKILLFILLPCLIVAFTVGWFIIPMPNFLIPVFLILFTCITCVYIHRFFYISIFKKFSLCVPLFLCLLSGPLSIIRTYRSDNSLGEAAQADMPGLILYTLCDLAICMMVSILYIRHKYYETNK